MLILPHLILAPHIIIRLYKGTLPHKPIQFAFAESSRKRLHWAASSLREQKNCFPGTVALPWKITGHQTGRQGGRGPGLAESEGKAKSTFEKCTNFALLCPEYISPFDFSLRRPFSPAYQSFLQATEHEFPRKDVPKLTSKHLSTFSKTFRT